MKFGIAGYLPGMYIYYTINYLISRFHLYKFIVADVC